MTPDDADRAFRFFLKYFPYLPKEDAEDFRAFCVLKWMEGRDTRTYLGYMATDFFREHGVESKEKPKKIGVKKRGRRKDALQKQGNTELTDYHANAIAFDNEALKLFESTEWFEKTIHRLPLLEKTLLILVCKYDYKLHEVGKLIRFDGKQAASVTIARLFRRALNLSKGLPGQVSQHHDKVRR